MRLAIRCQCFSPSVRRLRTALMFAATLSVLFASSKLRADDKTPPFPLMAWDYADDEKTLKKMADCGINLVAFVPTQA